MAAYADVDQSVLVAVALRELAGHLPAIGQLTLTPDVLDRRADRADGRAGELR